eukprot:11136194-Alexandrium_andersonii.AAC.1
MGSGALAARGRRNGRKQWGNNGTASKGQGCAGPVCGRTGASSIVQPRSVCPCHLPGVGGASGALQCTRAHAFHRLREVAIYEARARESIGAAGTVPDPVAGPAVAEAAVGKAAAAVAATQAAVANSLASAPTRPKAQCRLGRLCDISIPYARTSCQTRSGGRGGRPGAGPCINMGSRMGISQAHHLNQSGVAEVGRRRAASSWSRGGRRASSPQ